MGAQRMPAAEVDISPDLVRRLLAAQQPDLAHLPVEVMAHGWDNIICRIGDDLVARLPRRAMALKFLRNEQRWLPVLAPHLPLPVPALLRAGRPRGRDLVGIGNRRHPPLHRAGRLGP